MKLINSSSSRSGFTLAEVAVTVVIVGIGLVMMLQSLNTTKMQSVHTRNLRLARELASLTLGEIEAGLYWEDIDDTLTGYYEDYPDFSYEVVFGDEMFYDYEEEDPYNRPFDNWAASQEWRQDQEGYDEDEEDEMVQPYEKVRVKIIFPKLGAWKNEFTLERWMGWERVYGPSEEDEEDLGGASGPPASTDQ